MTAVVVKAVTPDREIAWNDISRISNSEMKELMIDAVNRCDRLLGAIFASDAIVDALKDWNDPNWYDQLTLEDVDQLDEPTRKKASYSKLSAMQMSSRYVRCAPNVADDRSCDHHAERSSVLGSCFWPLIVRRSHRSIHCWHDRAARRSALPRERFSPMTQLRHGPDPLLKPVGCTSNSPSRSRLLYFRDYTGMVLRRHMLRGGHMRRRDFITLFGGAAAAGFPALPAHAQQPARQRRIAIAIPGRYWSKEEKANPYQRPFFEELARLGFVEGRNLIVDRYSSAGQDAYPDLARTVALSQPELILTGTTPMTFALQAATRAIPIVTIIGDPVAAGLVSSLARPGGNVTGVTIDAGIEIHGKRLSLLTEIKPSATRLAYLSSSAALKQPQAAMVKVAAEALKLSVLHIDLANLNEEAYTAASDSVQKANADLLLVADEAEHLSHIKALVGIATNAQIPAMYHFRDFVVAGGLMAYSLDGVQGIRQVAQQVAQILNGENPAEMPFRQPTSFKLSINTTAARHIGVVLPPTLLGSADEVIE